MTHGHDARRAYVGRGVTDVRGETCNVMFVVCSENHAAAAMVAACEPAIVLQTFGGARDPSDASTRATFEYAVRLKGVRKVIVCGHLDCKAVAVDGGADARTKTQADVVAQCHRLRKDAHIGALVRHYGVSFHAIWFDDREADVYMCDIERRHVTLVPDEEIGRLIESFKGPKQ